MLSLSLSVRERPLLLLRAFTGCAMPVGKALSQSNQINQFPFYPVSTRCPCTSALSHIAPSPHNRRSLVPRRTGKKLLQLLRCRPSHVRRRHPIGGTLGICLGKLKEKVAAQSSLPVNWPVATLGGTQAKSIGQWLTPRHPHRSSRDTVHLSSALHYSEHARVLNI